MSRATRDYIIFFLWWRIFFAVVHLCPAPIPDGRYRLR